MDLYTSPDASGVTFEYKEIKCGSRRGNIWYDYEAINEDTGTLEEDVIFQQSRAGSYNRVRVSNVHLQYDTQYTFNVFGIYSDSLAPGLKSSDSARTFTEGMTFFFLFSIYLSSVFFSYFCK